MANNVAQLTTLITNDLTRSDISAAQILYELKAAIRDYEGYRFHFNEKAATATISATNCYALTVFGAKVATGAEFVEVDSVHATVNSLTYPLEEVPFTEWRDLTSSTTLTGDPYKYAIFDSSLYLYPTPGGTYSATIAGLVKYAELVSQSSSSVWTDAGRELVRCSALKRLWGRLIKDPAMAEMMQYAEQQALVALQRRADAMVSNRIAPWL